MTTIDLTDPTLSSALDDWASALGVLAGVNQQLIETVQQHFDLDDGLVPFDRVRTTQSVRLAGEWWSVLGRRTDATGNQWLVVAGEGHADWDYEVGDGERFAVDEGAF